LCPRLTTGVRYPERVAKHVEIEVKISVASASRVRALLKAARFPVTSRRALEQNVVLDDDSGSLRTRGLLLRIRTTGTRDAGQNPLCTFKGPARETATHHKQREEREFSPGDAQGCLDVFAGIGLQPAFRYEKFRTVYARKNDQGYIVLDETPMGVFLELEGPAQWIDRTASALGFSRSDYITMSYPRLWETWRAAHELPFGDMLFA
jgi:adenylate cyclase class 2